MPARCWRVVFYSSSYMWYRYVFLHYKVVYNYLICGIRIVVSAVGVGRGCHGLHAVPERTQWLDDGIHQ